MATKGTAAKSAKGAAMSQYDVEVESRLQALEAKSGESDSERVALLEEKFKHLISELRAARLPLDFNSLNL